MPTQEIPSAASLFLGVGVRWVCSRDSAGTQVAARGFLHHQVGNLCWFRAKRCRAESKRDDTLTHILFNAPRHGLWKKVRSLPARRECNEHFIEFEAAAINVSFTLLASLPFCSRRNFIFLSPPFMLKFPLIIPVISYRLRNQNDWSEINMTMKNDNYK